MNAYQSLKLKKMKVLKLLFTVNIALIMLVSSCKKDKITAETPINTTNASRLELTKDSLFLYAKQVYLWNDALPTYEAFNPRKYATLDLELFALTQLKINPSTGLPYEYIADDKGQIMEPKYSYIEDLVASGKISFVNEKSAVGLDGEGNDFGFGGLSAVGTSTDFKIYIRYASPSSPLAKNGIARGDYIDEINGRKVGTNFNAEVDYINSTLYSTTSTALSIGGKKKNGQSYSVNLTRTKYTSNPVLKDTVLTTANVKVGYLAYARFSTTENSEAVLNAAFAKFSVQNVENLVIDLRYNGGGYVSTARQLINLIAPVSLNGSLMFSETYNSMMQNGQATILKNQPVRDQNNKIIYQNGKMVTYADYSYAKSTNSFNFSKLGNLNNVKKVVFIVGGGTASSSELVINCLKPHIDVKIVGAQSYGKPVGFFPIRIDKYDVYYSMFSTTNSLGQGDYFAGFTPNSLKPDDITRDFGDSAEIRTAAALSYIANGNFPASTTSSLKVDNVSTPVSATTIRDIGEPASFRGMIETTLRKQ
jgi:C-terminal processing protease CtpA/Prc